MINDGEFPMAWKNKLASNSIGNTPMPKTPKTGSKMPTSKITKPIKPMGANKTTKRMGF